MSEERKLCEAATEGPWGVFHDDMVIVVPGVDDIAFYTKGHESDGDFIAHFNPSRVLEMLDEIEAKDKQIKELEELSRGWRDRWRCLNYRGLIKLNHTQHTENGGGKGKCYSGSNL